MSPLLHTYIRLPGEQAWEDTRAKGFPKYSVFMSISERKPWDSDLSGQRAKEKIIQGQLGTQSTKHSCIPLVLGNHKYLDQTKGYLQGIEA